jgi:L-ascorbate metabolism protein UlaG (beta-lactamase superfamily)
MLENIHWLGHDTFRLDGSSTVYIDPWKLPAGAVPADLILVTHDHYDHFSVADIARIGSAATTLIGPAVVTAQASGVTTVTLAPGETTIVGGVSVTAVPAYNLDKFRAPGEPYHPREAGYLGYVVEMDGLRIYHAGDTDATSEMSDVRCDVALLPVGGTYTMTAEEAAEACDALGASAAVPMHFADIVGTRADAERFRELCRIPVTILPSERP